MFQILFLNLILLWQPSHGVEVDVSTMTACPYPLPEMIQPCQCFADQSYKVYLVCDLQEDLTELILRRISNSLVCTEIDYLSVNLNNNSWKADFDSRSFGLLNVKDVHIFNASQIEGNIEAGAFDGRSRLSQFVIEDSSTNGKGQISGYSFSSLRYLETIKLGNNFAHLKSSSFSNLTKLSTLIISPNSLKTIEDRALNHLPSLKELDLSHQLLTDLPREFISNCPNVTNIDLSFNSLEDLQDGCFSGIGGLSFLDLSHNKLAFVGSIFDDLVSQDLVVDLSNNLINFFPETHFKSFISMRRKGFIDFGNNELHCGCTIQWLLNSNLMWNDLFKNASCANDVPLKEVDEVLLDKMCPTSNCPLYEEPIVEPITTVPDELQDGLLISQSGTYSFQLPLSKIYLFLIGGGGYGSEDEKAGSSGFFESQSITAEGNVSFSVNIGQGGSANDGYPTTVVVDGQTFTAKGGGRDGRSGWSGGGDEANGRGGSNGSSGTQGRGTSLNNGQNIALPSRAELVAGAGGVGDSVDGGGGGGVIINGQKPSRRNTIDGEGYGAGGGEKNRSGYPGAVFIKVEQ